MKQNNPTELLGYSFIKIAMAPHTSTDPKSGFVPDSPGFAKISYGNSASFRLQGLSSPCKNVTFGFVALQTRLKMQTVDFMAFETGLQMQTCCFVAFQTGVEMRQLVSCASRPARILTIFVFKVNLIKNSNPTY